MTDNRLAALEAENKKLRNDLDRAMRAIDRLQAQVRDVKKTASTAYHAGRDAANQIGQINRILRNK